MAPGQSVSRIPGSKKTVTPPVGERSSRGRTRIRSASRPTRRVVPPRKGPEKIPWVMAWATSLRLEQRRRLT